MAKSFQPNKKFDYGVRFYVPGMEARLKRRLKALGCENVDEAIASSSTLLHYAKKAAQKDKLKLNTHIGQIFSVLLLGENWKPPRQRKRLCSPSA